ncbi:hypothetical protein WN51_09316 [Melipona quadrifasciata]|uniref:Uncharacterized protein n=1 Tax=Melipona quadrifasciata TaxID=166423 RepID=A0A0N0U6E3_9HYME|nr:hypothetical protein WN51_09316 [Melipona quadrifasciata]
MSNENGCNNLNSEERTEKIQSVMLSHADATTHTLQANQVKEYPELLMRDHETRFGIGHNSCFPFDSSVHIRSDVCAKPNEFVPGLNGT